MTNRLLLLGILLPVLIILTTPGQSYGSEPSGDDYASGIAQASPWISALEKKLKNQPGYSNLASDFGNSTESGDTLSCLFMVTEAGKILNPRVVSAPCGLDDRVLAFIKNAEPLSPPPCKLLLDRGVQVILVRYKKHGYLCCVLNLQNDMPSRLRSQPDSNLAR